MRPANRVVAAGLALSLLGSWSCYLDDLEAPNGSGGGSRAGNITVNLATPNSDDGAVRVTFTGPQVTTPQASAGNVVLYSSQRSPEVLDVIVVGDLQAGPLFSVAVIDIDRIGEYSASVTEVAARDDTMRADASGYSLSLVAAIN